MAQTILDGHGATQVGPTEVPVLLPALVKPCPRCEGSGTVYSAAWKAFDAKYPDAEEWKAAIDRGEEPGEPEEQDCPRCRGTGDVLTPAGEQVAKVIQLMK